MNIDFDLKALLSWEDCGVKTALSIIQAVKSYKHTF